MNPITWIDAFRALLILLCLPLLTLAEQQGLTLSVDGDVYSNVVFVSSSQSSVSIRHSTGITTLPLSKLPVEFQKRFGYVQNRAVNQDLNPQIKPDNAAQVGRKPERSSVIDKLNSIVMPSIRFREARLSDVCSYLTEESKKLDPERNGVSIFVKSDGADEILVTLSLREIPLVEVLRSIAELTGVQLKIVSESILISKPSGKLYVESLFNQGEGEQRKQQLRKKLETIIIPQIRFRSAFLKDVIMYLAEESEKTDSQGLGVSFVVPECPAFELSKWEDGGSKGVTLDLRNKPLVEILSIISALTDVNFRLEPGAVWAICPNDPRKFNKYDVISANTPIVGSSGSDLGRQKPDAPKTPSATGKFLLEIDGHSYDFTQAMLDERALKEWESNRVLEPKEPKKPSLPEKNNSEPVYSEYKSMGSDMTSLSCYHQEVAKYNHDLAEYPRQKKLFDIWEPERKRREQNVRRWGLIKLNGRIIQVISEGLLMIHDHNVVCLQKLPTEDKYAQGETVSTLAVRRGRLRYLTVENDYKTVPLYYAAKYVDSKQNTKPLEKYEFPDDTD